MKLSILDQSPISTGKTAQKALQSSVRLAQQGERLGYHRFWIAEHHDLFGLANPNPAVMLGVIGTKTKTIRIGAGAVLLPYYKPFRVAETYNLLATLFPDRVDLGLGRAPGGSAEVSLALSDNYLKQVRNYEKDIDELTDFLQGNFPADHPYGKISPTPVPDTAPEVWLLGTSEKSAYLAAEKGLFYAFGDFMTDFMGQEIVQLYRAHFNKSHPIKIKPYVIIAVHVICASTTEEAEGLVLSNIVWKLKQDKQAAEKTIPTLEEAKLYSFTAEEKEKAAEIKEKMIIGNPQQVKEQLISVQKKYQADELMLVTITHEEEAKLKSYRLVKERF